MDPSPGVSQPAAVVSVAGRLGAARAHRTDRVGPRRASRAINTRASAISASVYCAKSLSCNNCLLEFLSDFAVTIPELGTVSAEHRPIVVLTSNRTRELHDALKRPCLYHLALRTALCSSRSVLERFDRAFTSVFGELHSLSRFGEDPLELYAPQLDVSHPTILQTHGLWDPTRTGDYSGRCAST
jgi:hypothetical protein